MDFDDRGSGLRDESPRDHYYGSEPYPLAYDNTPVYNNICKTSQISKMNLITDPILVTLSNFSIFAINLLRCVVTLRSQIFMNEFGYRIYISF